MRFPLFLLLAACQFDYDMDGKPEEKPDTDTAGDTSSVDTVDTSETGGTTTDSTDSGTTDSVPTDTAEECPYTLFISDTEVSEPICSGDFEETTDLEDGNLFKATSITTLYYYIDDGSGSVERRAIQYGSVFESWWGTDPCVCADVKVVPDQNVSEITLAGNLTIKPGAFIMKIHSDPTLYVIDEACSVRETSEAVLAEIYGEAWADLVRPIEDWFFTDYEMGPPVVTASDYDLAAASATTLEDAIAGCGN